jgi:hypothetical protein
VASLVRALAVESHVAVMENAVDPACTVPCAVVMLTYVSDVTQVREASVQGAKLRCTAAATARFIIFAQMAT